MREHEARRLEVEREAGHPFHATKTDAVRSLFDANHAADLEHRRTPDIVGGISSEEIADELRYEAQNYRSADIMLRALLNRAARRIDAMREQIKKDACESRYASEELREAEDTVARFFKRDDFWYETASRIETLCDQNNIAGIRAELRSAYEMPHRIARNGITEKHFKDRRRDR